MSQVYSPHQLEVARRGGVPWIFPAVLVVGLFAMAGVGYAWSSSRRSNRVASEDYASLANRLSENQQRLAQTEDTNAQLRGQVNVVAERLQLTPVEKAEAHRLADEFRRMSGEQLAKLDAGVLSELDAKANESDLKEYSAKSSGEVAEVRTEVGGVRKEINYAKKEWQAALTEMNKLIERNQHEIAMLNRLGQRTDYDFVLDGKGTAKTIAGVNVQLKDSNVKKNQFTVTLTFGTTRLVKKNALLDEPIYFYVPGEYAPMEIVVNQVDKHRVAGRLSVLRAPVPASTAPANTVAAATSRKSP
jgi:hypothetical protein